MEINLKDILTSRNYHQLRKHYLVDGKVKLCVNVSCEAEYYCIS